MVKATFYYCLDGDTRKRTSKCTKTFESEDDLWNAVEYECFDVIDVDERGDRIAVYFDRGDS